MRETLPIRFDKHGVFQIEDDSLLGAVSGYGPLVSVNGQCPGSPTNNPCVFVDAVCGSASQDNAACVGANAACGANIGCNIKDPDSLLQLNAACG